MGKLLLKRTFVFVLAMLSWVVFTAKGQTARFRVLIVASKAKDHWKSIGEGKAFFEKLGAENHFRVDFTDDTSTITNANLRKYQVFVMFHLAPFDMSFNQQAALQQFVEEGKGWVGVHAAGLTGKQFLGADSKMVYWQWFEGLMGDVVYSPHPAYQDGMVMVEDRTHPVTKNLPAKFWMSDEWYEYDKSPRSNVHVLATVDESTYKQNKPMGDHPMIWTNEKFHRMIYLCMGHSPTALTNPSYVILMRDAILWAASN